MYTFHQCSKCSNLESVPFDVGYVCPKTGKEFDRKEVNKPYYVDITRRKKYGTTELGV